MFFAGIAMLLLGLVAAVLVSVSSRHDGDDTDHDSSAEIPGPRDACASERLISN